MNTMTLSFDFAGMAIEKIQHVERVDRYATKQVEISKRAASFVPVFMSSWIGRVLARYLYKKSESLIQDAVFLEGAAYKLSAQIAETFALPGVELVNTLGSFLPKLSEAISSCEQAVNFFEARNSNSPPALAFRKVILALKQVASAAELLRAVAAGSSISGVSMPYSGVESWEEAVQHQRDVFNEVRGRIRSGDTADIDDELLEMASKAILASNSRDLRQDQDWVSRMSRSTVH